MEPTQWTALRDARLGLLDGKALPPDLTVPVLPPFMTEFSQKAGRPDADTKELAQIVESDAAIACELLWMVNSAAGGGNKVKTVAEAIAALGLRNIGLLLTTAAVKSVMSSRKSKLINIQLFWNTNFERALFARDLAGTMNADKILAFAGAMLSDFLLPILTSELLDSYVAFSERAHRESLSLPAFERQTWGWDHALAAGKFLRDWQVPDDLSCCVLHHHQGLDILSDPALGRTALGAVAIAGLLPDFFHQTADGLERLTKLDVAWPAFRLHDRLKRVAGQFQEMHLAQSTGHITFLNRYEKKLAAMV